MRFARSNRYLLDPREKKTLARMAKNADEGDASDGDSLEEITAADFRQDSSRLRSARVWMPDMSMYPMSRSFTTPNLYSFAWAQAVQNKPLGFAGKEESCSVDVENNSEEVGFESEKEEGELEEGEIELGSEQLVAPSSNEPEKESVEEEPEEMDDIDSCVSQFLEELEMITVKEAESSFDAVCLRLRKSFESLKDMFLKNRVPVLDALVQQAFMGIQTIYSVLSSMKLKDKERNEDLLLRLLVHIKSQYSLLLTPERINEMDEMVKSVVSDNNMKERKHGSSVNMKCNTNGLNSSKMPSFNQRTENNVINDSGMDGFAKLETPLIAKKRVEFTPLLDLHANYDESSLPSPTRETAPPLPLQKPVTPDCPMSLKRAGAQGDKLHLYHTDAIRAVSSYQQKYGQTSLSINRLPSPTPSDDCDVNDDTHGEISSTYSGSNTRTVNYESSLHLLGNSSSSSGTIAVSSTGFQTDPVKSLSPATKAPTKSRDPRLRMLNSEVVGTDVSNKVPMAVGTNTSNDLNMRKNKAVADSTLDDHISKKQRNGFTDSRDGETTTGSGGWLEGGSDEAPLLSNKKPENGPNKKPECGTLSAGTDLAVTLPSLLKGIAVNPLILMELLKMEQQRLAARVQQSTVSTHDTVVSSNSNILATGASLVNNVSVKPSEFELVSGPSQLSIQTALMNPQTEAGTIRMKPRDPRRVLHNNVLHKGESSKSEPTNINRNPSPGGLNSHSLVRQQDQQAQTTILHTHRTPQPDISQPFTANLKNLADMISSSQSASMSSLVPQSSSQSTLTMMKAVNANSAAAAAAAAAADLSDGSTPVVPQAPNPWGDVDHLLDGYDDQQKAAIQRERSRRIEEQNKMFAARKLCLVLDLDHTLLNSAKFIEVDPVHEEILRKKEEQDRENPQRHLFRFPHMGMWTKMRPGIWNFLERASKLFVLHLYTMGNKLYATEMAKVLDPKGTLFAGRVISRGDDGDVVDGVESVPKSKDLEGVLGMESAVVIIDDSVRVWPHNKLNLIVVERYTYFPCSRRQFGLLGPSLLEVDHDERPEDGTLSSSLAVIERIHHNFFSHRSMSEVDVRNILAVEQRKILAGCTILFSRIFPMGDANARMHPLWQTAEQFGASCTNQINEQVTHVVGNLLGTDKVNWALSTGRFVVTPGWVEASALLYRRVNEHDFPVKEGPETGFVPPRSRR